jgi:hypothetical protein
MHQPPKAIDCQQCGGLLVPELDWPAHVAQHRRGEIPNRAAGGAAYPYLSATDAAELARYRRAGGNPLQLHASELQEWRDTANEAARGGHVFAARLITALNEIERLKAAFVPRPPRRFVHGGLLAPDAPPLSDRELGKIRELARRPELNAYQWCETNTVPRLLDHIDLQAAELREAAQHVMQLQTEREHDAAELEALRADAEGRRHAEHLLRTAGARGGAPAALLGELLVQTAGLARDLEGFAPAFRALCNRVASLERFAATTEARRTAAELGAQPAAVEPPPTAAEPHQPEPTGPADAHAKCIGLDNGCVECLKTRDANRSANPFHCVKRSDGGDCSPDESFHCIHCGRVIVGPPSES